MNMHRARILSVFTVFFVFAVLSANSQERVVQGIVTTFDSIPLIGADVQVASTKAVVKTDIV